MQKRTILRTKKNKEERKKNSLLKFRAIRFSKLEEGYSRNPFMMTVGAALWSNAPSLYPPGRH